MATDENTITPIQKQLLEQYQTFYHKPPSVTSLMTLSARGHVLMVVVFAAAAVLCFSIGIAPVGYVMIGMLVGAISRDLGQFRKLTQAWPVLFKLINWQSLNALLCGEPPDTDA